MRNMRSVTLSRRLPQLNGGSAQPSPTIAECLNGGWLAGGEVPSMRDQGQHPAGRDQATAQYANLEAGGLSEMPIMPQGQVRPAGSYDPADRDAGDHAVRTRTKNDRLASIPRGTLADPQNPIFNKSRANFLVSFEQSGRQSHTLWFSCSAGLHSRSRRSREMVVARLLYASNQCQLGKERLDHNRLQQQD